MGPETFYFLFMTGGLLVCGTFNSLIAKLIYGLKSTGVACLPAALPYMP